MAQRGRRQDLRALAADRLPSPRAVTVRFTDLSFRSFAERHFRQYGGNPLWYSVIGLRETPQLAAVLPPVQQCLYDFCEHA